MGGRGSSSTRQGKPAEASAATTGGSGPTLDEEDQAATDGVAGDAKGTGIAMNAAETAATQAIAAIRRAERGTRLEHNVREADGHLVRARGLAKEARSRANDAKEGASTIRDPAAKSAAQERARGASVQAKNAENAVNRAESIVNSARRAAFSDS